MKNLKTFNTKKELDRAIEALEKQGIQAKGQSENNEHIVCVHVGSFIKARDILLDMKDETIKQEIDS